MSVNKYQDIHSQPRSNPRRSRQILNTHNREEHLRLTPVRKPQDAESLAKANHPHCRIEHNGQQLKFPQGPRFFRHYDYVE